MTLKANRSKAFRKTFLSYFLLTLALVAIPGVLKGTRFDVGELLGFCTMAGFVFGLVLVLGQTPREINWDDDSVSICSIIPGSGEYRWDQLVYYRPERFRTFGLFVLKFAGGMPYQISAAGFDEEGWNQLQKFLEQHHPGKRKTGWL
ncbi:MAG: hypothetical protein EOP84_21235 [Verrucomicrobiaceae bacterium]|nr:MAG: hypothetical protein EOP84_21235 [Verrucomicrobiaceae bacterium]